MIGIFGGRPGADCGFGVGVVGVVGAVVAAGYAWWERVGALGIEAGLEADWETVSGDVAGDGVGAGGVVEGEDAEAQTGTEARTWTGVWGELAGCAGTVGRGAGA